MSLTSTTQKVYEMYSSMTYKLSIPEYQRGYSWKKHEIGTLIDDISEFCLMPESKSYDERANELNSRSYFIGTIIINDVPTTELTRDIVDGQQRSVTISMICHHLLNYFKKLADTVERSDQVKSFSTIKEWKHYDYNHVVNALRRMVYGDDDTPRLRLKYNDDVNYHECLGKPIFNAKADDRESNIKNGFTTIDKILKSSMNYVHEVLPFLTLDQIYVEFTYKLLMASKVVSFKINGPDGENRESILNIFKVVNSRGLPLNTATTVWNEFTSAIKKSTNPATPKMNAIAVMSNEINTFITNEQERDEFIESCLRGYYYQIKFDKPKGSLVSVYEDILRGTNSEFPIDNTLIGLSKYIIASIRSKNVESYPKDCVSLFNIINRIKRDNGLDNTLALLYDQKKLTAENLWNLLRLSLYTNMSDRISRDQKLRCYISFMKDILTNKDFDTVNKIYDHTEMIEILKKSDIYKETNVSHAVVILAMYATEVHYKRYHEYISSTQISEFQIEHIASQSPSDGQSIDNVHRLGNLIPLDPTRNIVASNNPFIEKRDSSYKGSILAIVSELKDYDTWTDAIVEERSNQIADRISYFLSNFDSVTFKRKVEIEDKEDKIDINSLKNNSEKDSNKSQRLTSIQTIAINSLVYGKAMERFDIEQNLSEPVTQKGLSRALNDLSKSGYIIIDENNAHTLTEKGYELRQELKKRSNKG